jgi:hypothetical protein
MTALESGAEPRAASRLAVRVWSASTLPTTARRPPASTRCASVPSRWAGPRSRSSPSTATSATTARRPPTVKVGFPRLCGAPHSRGELQCSNIVAARLSLERIFDWAAQVDIAEVTRLDTTIDRWRDEVLAYFRSGRPSCGPPVEAVKGESERSIGVRPGIPELPAHYRTRMLLDTVACWHTPTTSRLRGRSVHSGPAG